MKTKVWSLTFLVLVGTPCFIFSILHGYLPESSWPLIISWLVFAFIALLIIKTSVCQVSEQEVWLTERFGKFNEKLAPGLHFILPFGIENVSSKVFLGKQMLELSLKTDGGSGDVDLKDCSVGIACCFYYRIDNAYTVTYTIEDLKGEISKKVESILRDYLAIYDLDDAMALKGRFNKEIIACRIPLTDGPNPNVDDEVYKESKFYKSLKDVGIKPESLDIVDFCLPNSITEQRQKSLVAEEENKAAEIVLKKTKIENKILVAQAEAKKKAKILEGQGEASHISSVLAASGIKDGRSADYLTQIKKWDSIAASKSTDKVIIVEDGGNQVGAGVKFGTGVGAAGRNQFQKPQTQQNLTPTQKPTPIQSQQPQPQPQPQQPKQKP